MKTVASLFAITLGVLALCAPLVARADIVFARPALGEGHGPAFASGGTATHSFVEAYRESTEAQRGSAYVGVARPGRPADAGALQFDALGTPIGLGWTVQGNAVAAQRPRVPDQDGSAPSGEGRADAMQISRGDRASAGPGLAWMSGLAIAAFILLRRAGRQA